MCPPCVGGSYYPNRACTSHGTCLMVCRARNGSATFRRTRGHLVGSIARIRPQLHRHCGRVRRGSPSSRGTDSSVHIQSPATQSRWRTRRHRITSAAVVRSPGYFKATFAKSQKLVLLESERHVLSIDWRSVHSKGQHFNCESSYPSRQSVASGCFSQCEMCLFR